MEGLVLDRRKVSSSLLLSGEKEERGGEDGDLMEAS